MNIEKKVVMILALLSVISAFSCAKKESVVYINSQNLQKSKVAIDPATEKNIKKIVGNEVLLPETKKKEIVEIIKKEKAKVKKQVEGKVSKIITSYKKEKIKKEISLLKEPITPIKTPDVILRILLLPYVDEDNSFHSGEYLFVKVEEGKWILGEYIKQGKKIIKEYNPLAEENNESSRFQNAVRKGKNN